MSTSLPPSQAPPPMDSRKAAVALAVSVACLVYAASLLLQRALPELKDWLGIALPGGVRPTYYLRVLVSLLAGAIPLVAVPRGPRSERALAWITGVSVAVAVAILVLCP